MAAQAAPLAPDEDETHTLTRAIVRRLEETVERAKTVKALEAFETTRRHRQTLEDVLHPVAPIIVDRQARGSPKFADLRPAVHRSVEVERLERFVDEVVRHRPALPAEREPALRLYDRS